MPPAGSVLSASGRAREVAPGPVVWREVYAGATRRLGSPIEARWLVEAASGSTLVRVLDEPVSARAVTWIDQRVSRRVAGEPLQYVLGEWAFRRLDLLVDRRVLIPRPETEQVVEVALGELRRLAALGPRQLAGRGEPAAGGSPPLVVDLGTGSGAVALSIAAEHPDAVVWATDVSPDALDVARANLAGLGGSAAARVRLVEGEWWTALPAEMRGGVDLVVSNPPYITTDEMGDLDAVVTGWEPRIALQAGPDGLESITVILAGAPQWLAPGGVAVVEIAPHQAGRAADVARRAGFAEVEVHPDLAGRDRVLVARGAGFALRGSEGI